MGEMTTCFLMGSQLPLHLTFRLHQMCVSSPHNATMILFSQLEYSEFINILNTLSAFLLQFDGFQKNSIQMVKPAKGTTTLAFIFKEGVMVAADSRASMGGYICIHLFF